MQTSNEKFDYDINNIIKQMQVASCWPASIDSTK